MTRFFKPQVKNMRSLSIKQAKHMPEYRAISERHDNAGFVLKKSDVFALQPMWSSHNICLKRIYEILLIRFESIIIRGWITEKHFSMTQFVNMTRTFAWIWIQIFDSLNS